MKPAQFIPWIPVIGQLIWLGEKIAKRVRARRARRRGEPVCDDVPSAREVFDDGVEAAKSGRDAYRQTKRGK